MNISRYRMRFEKRDALRFISHHDLMRVFELALRRSGLGVAFTQGFNPHPRVSFALALPLGVESLDELVDIDLQHEAGPPEPSGVLAVLAAQMPAGLRLKDAVLASGRPRVAAQEFSCELPPVPELLEQTVQRLAELLAKAGIPYTRSRGEGKAARSFDARAYVLGAVLHGSTLRMRLKSTAEGGMKPSDLLALLGLDPLAHLVTKTRTLLEEDLPTAPPLS